jgi:hypothetical protein
MNGRKLKPYLSLQRIQTPDEPDQYVMHIFLLLDDNKKASCQVLPGTHVKNGSIRKRMCTKIFVQVEPAPGQLNPSPVHIETPPFERPDGVDKIWVFVKPIVGGNPDEGGVGDYDDPDP